MCRGYFECEIECSGNPLLEMTWGEHLEDSRVRSRIGDRNFYGAYRCRVGRQRFREPFRRLGARYLQIYVSDIGDGLTLHFCGLRFCGRNVEMIGLPEGIDEEWRRILSGCDRTLRCCMGDVFEDTPWREQTLYAHDALNQSLSGYYLYGNYSFARASLELLGQGLREDGYLALAAPSDLPITIPGFTFIWIVAVERNFRFSGDREWATGQFAVVSRILKGMEDRLDNGLLPSPRGPGYWHFYDWTDGGLNGCEGTDALVFSRLEETRFDSVLNALILRALESACWMGEWLGYHDPVKRWKGIARTMRDAFRVRFWDESRQVVRIFAAPETPPPIENSGVAELAQALALLAGGVPGEFGDTLWDRFARGNEGWIRASLSQTHHIGDALALKAEGVGVLDRRIREDWLPMLEQGPGTFWETRDGAAAFDGAGSLCHGWSATPAYLFGRYFDGVWPTSPGGATNESGSL